MTSTVKVTAHCATDKVVIVLAFDNTTGLCTERYELEDGQEQEIHVYDSRAVTTMEVLKSDLVDAPDPDDAAVTIPVDPEELAERYPNGVPEGFDPNVLFTHEHKQHTDAELREATDAICAELGKDEPSRMDHGASTED